jgi:signal-transduction protein with cAMP-binding, CBS, and nucleotidyltransferase domain
MMTFMEKFIALRRISCFEQMNDAELSILAHKVKERSFSPDATISEAAKPLEMLYVIISGGVLRESGAPTPQLIGGASLLFGLPVAERLVAAHDTGAHCLVIKRPYFFTILRQFPAFLSFLFSLETEQIEVIEKERGSA